MKEIKVKPVTFYVMKTFTDSMTIYVPENVNLKELKLTSDGDFWRILYQNFNHLNDYDESDSEYWGKIFHNDSNPEYVEEYVLEEDLETLSSLEEFREKHLIVK